MVGVGEGRRMSFMERRHKPQQAPHIPHLLPISFEVGGKTSRVYIRLARGNKPVCLVRRANHSMLKSRALVVTKNHHFTGNIGIHFVLNRLN